MPLEKQGNVQFNPFKWGFHLYCTLSWPPASECWNSHPDFINVQTPSHYEVFTAWASHWNENSSGHQAVQKRLHQKSSFLSKQDAFVCLLADCRRCICCSLVLLRGKYMLAQQSVRTMCGSFKQRKLQTLQRAVRVHRIPHNRKQTGWTGSNISI